MGIFQHHYGHRAEKKTFLYIVGARPCEIPPIPFTLDTPTHVIETRKKFRRLPAVTKREREATPQPLCRWLIDLCQVIDRNAGRRPD